MKFSLSFFERRLSLLRISQTVESGVRLCLTSLCIGLAIAASAGWSNGQKRAAPGTQAVKPAAPKVTQVNEVALKKLLQPDGKPLLINFWATWCDPCREEFPDLVKFDAGNKGKLNFITISLDDLAEINRDVPKFLSEMKAEMPAYLLKTADENAAIRLVTNEWTGGLPFTILFDASGKTAYFRQGKVKIETLEAELEKVLSSPAAKN